MKEEYYRFLDNHNMVDHLSEIKYISFSKKLDILTELKVEFGIDILKKALISYKDRYIKLGRVDITRTKTMLTNICKSISKKEK